MLGPLAGIAAPAHQTALDQHRVPPPLFQLADGAAMRRDKGFRLTQLLQFLFKLLLTGFERLLVK